MYGRNNHSNKWLTVVVSQSGVISNIGIGRVGVAVVVIGMVIAKHTCTNANIWNKQYME